MTRSRWTKRALLAVALLSLALTLIRGSWQRTDEFMRRVDALAGAVQVLVERIDAMSSTNPTVPTVTAEVPCPKTGIPNTVCTPREPEWTRQQWAAEHLANVQAFVTACAEE